MEGLMRWELTKDEDITTWASLEEYVFGRTSKQNPSHAMRGPELWTWAALSDSLNIHPF